VIFVSIDGNELHHAKMLMDEVFGPQSHKNTIAVRRGIKSVQSQFEDIDRLSQGHEYILFYARKGTLRLPKLSIGIEVEKPGKWDTFWRGTDRHTMRYELFGRSPETGQWRWEKGRTNRAIKNYEDYLEKHAGDMSLDEWFLDNLTANNLKLDFVRQSEDGVAQYYVPPRGGKLSSDNWMDIPWSQVSSATVDLKAAISSAMASAGVLQPSVFLGRLFINAATSLSQVWLTSLRSVPLGMN